MTADSVISLGARWTVITGDNAEALPSIPDCSVDAVVTDPPAGIAFMGKEWDHHKGGRDAWIAWLRGVMAECLRVLKPGGHALIWAIPRTSHWTMTAVEDAGFEIRDVVFHMFGSGFPKGFKVARAVESTLVNGSSTPSAQARARAVSGQEQPVSEEHAGGLHFQSGTGGSGKLRNEPGSPWRLATPEAAQWEGWGTALKPAVEPWILARKPLDGTVAANVLRHGTGALNIDGCRVGVSGGTAKGSFPRDGAVSALGNGINGDCEIIDLNAGRFPAHLTLSHNPDCDAECSEGCVVAMLDARSDSASRFFYTAKASRSDREEGLAGMAVAPARSSANGTNGKKDRFDGQPTPMRANIHPTVKPTDLMRWLVRLITPPGGIVLDPFTGSGSTGKAAALEGMRFIGVERSPEYADIARARIAHAYDFGTTLKRKKAPRPKRSAEPVQLTIDGVNAAE